MSPYISYFFSPFPLSVLLMFDFVIILYIHIRSKSINLFHKFPFFHLTYRYQNPLRKIPMGNMDNQLDIKLLIACFKNFIAIMKLFNLLVTKVKRKDFSYTVSVNVCRQSKIYITHTILTVKS